MLRALEREWLDSEGSKKFRPLSQTTATPKHLGAIFTGSQISNGICIQCPSGQYVLTTRIPVALLLPKDFPT